VQGLGNRLQAHYKLATKGKQHTHFARKDHHPRAGILDAFQILCHQNHSSLPRNALQPPENGTPHFGCGALNIRIAGWKYRAKRRPRLVQKFKID